jgi:hypothetical protein
MFAQSPDLPDLATMFIQPAAAPAFATPDLDIPDRRHLTSRLIRRANLSLRATVRPASVATLARLSEFANQQRMLFVVGAARCGTTAMQRALNASAEVFLLGEAYFFWENLKPGFRARYNAKHRAFGYPASKQNDCPAVAPENSTWVETVAALASKHRFVGEKVAFGSYKADWWPSEFLLFQRRHFHAAAYILAFRNPRDAILSPRGAWGIQNLAPWARSYIAAQRALLRLRRNFPRTVPVFLETIEPAMFQAIEQCLGYPMPQLSALMFRKAESSRDPQQIPPDLCETVADLEALYPALREAVSNSPRADASLESIDTRLAEVQCRLERCHLNTVDARLSELRRRLDRAW